MSRWKPVVRRGEQTTLDRVRPGTRVRVSGFLGGWRGSERLLKMGIGPGVEVLTVSQYPLKGPVVVRVDESQIALGRGLARKILVEPLP